MTHAGSPPRILVVDDERAVTDILAELLEDEGYRVVRAYNGEEALRILRSENAPDLVLSDVMMPKVTGTELVAQARRERHLHDLPFLLLSAGTEPRLTAKDVAFMPKPLHLESLLVQVQRLLDGCPAQTAARVE